MTAATGEGVIGLEISMMVSNSEHEQNTNCSILPSGLRAMYSSLLDDPLAPAE
jgi:hypothetical protein